MLKVLKRCSFNRMMLPVSIAVCLSPSVQALEDAIGDAIAAGKATLDVRVRHESVDNTADFADRLTIRTRLGYTTGEVHGFSGTLEFEDNRNMFGIDDPDNAVADNEFTELEQSFIKYKSDIVTAKVGRQVLTYDGHRHVGHVGWRQDRQTFDAARVTLTPIKDLVIDLSYLWRRNRINSPNFADVTDSSDKLVNISYKTPFGKAVAYSYSLSAENSGPAWDETETYGLSFGGKTKGDIQFLYALEYAQQDNKTASVDTDYMFGEIGVSVAGITGKLGYEVLGSDTNGATTENFQTPLATVHKLNGWADVFLGGSLFGTIAGGNGLEDTFVTVSGKVAGVKLVGVYHEYEAENGGADLGDEINLLAVKKFGKRYSAGLKYADYNAPVAAGDVKKLWVWVGMKI